MMKIPKSNRMSSIQLALSNSAVGASGSGTASTSGPDGTYEYKIACRRNEADQRYIRS